MVTFFKWTLQGKSFVDKLSVSNVTGASCYRNNIRDEITQRWNYYIFTLNQERIMKEGEGVDLLQIPLPFFILHS